MDYIDFSAEPSGEFKYIFLVQDIFPRKLWATAFKDNFMSNIVADLRALFTDFAKKKNPLIYFWLVMSQILFFLAIICIFLYKIARKLVKNALKRLYRVVPMSYSPK